MVAEAFQNGGDFVQEVQAHVTPFNNKAQNLMNYMVTDSSAWEQLEQLRIDCLRMKARNGHLSYDLLYDLVMNSLTVNHTGVSA